MPTLVAEPTRITAAGNKPKLIDEYIGRVNSKTSSLSVAHMRSPQGWEEPGQAPEFDEFTVVLKGMLRVEHRGGRIDVRAGQARVSASAPYVIMVDQDAYPLRADDHTHYTSAALVDLGGAFASVLLP